MPFPTLSTATDLISISVLGWIPLMLPFGFGDGLSSTLDFETLWQTTRLTGEFLFEYILESVQEMVADAFWFFADFQGERC